MIKIKNKDDAAALLIDIHGVATEEQIVKLWEAVRRNTKVGGRDGVFWEPGATGYQTCPLTGMRKARFDNRTVSILGFTYDEYVAYLIKNNLPVPSKTNGFMDEVNAKLREKDPETGLSKRDVVVAKTKVVRSQIDPTTGLSNYAATGKKTSAGLLKVDSDGMTTARKSALARNNVIMDDGRTLQQHAVEKAFKTQIANGTLGGNFSKQAEEKLKPIIDWLEARGIIFHYGKNEYALTYAVNVKIGEWPLTSLGKHKAILDKKLFRTKELASEERIEGEVTQTGSFKYDLVIPSLNLNIEYNGLNTHPDPKMSKAEWDSWSFSQKGESISADDKAAYDKIKIDWLLARRNIHTIELWGPKSDTAPVFELLEALELENITS